MGSFIRDHIHLVQKTQTSFPRQKYRNSRVMTKINEVISRLIQSSKLLAAQRSFSQAPCDTFKSILKNMPRHRVGIQPGSLEHMGKKKDGCESLQRV